MRGSGLCCFSGKGQLVVKASWNLLPGLVLFREPEVGRVTGVEVAAMEAKWRAM